MAESLVDRVWVFPKERFVEYEPGDEWWCRKYGFGHEEVRPRQGFLQVGDNLYAHPAFWKKFCEAMDEARERRSRAVLEKLEPGFIGTAHEYDAPDWDKVRTIVDKFRAKYHGDPSWSVFDRLPEPTFSLPMMDRDIYFRVYEPVRAPVPICLLAVV